MMSHRNRKVVLSKILRWYLVLLLMIVLQSCYHYRVVNTINDPASVQYHDKVLWCYCWGLVNSPQTFTVGDCENNGMDEVRISTNLGTNLVTIITLGFVSPVKVEWKCHKPCLKVGTM